MVDVIIIGRGPAGISTALYTARANIKTLIIGKHESAIKTASKIENYYGFSEPISGEKLLSEGELQVKRLGVELIEDEIIDVKYNGDYEVSTNSKTYFAKSVLLATGYKQKKLKIQNIDKFEGVGISYCTTCDGFFFRNLKLGVIGNKDYAIHEAKELEAFSDKITLFTNGKDLDISDKYKKIAENYNINKNTIIKFEGNDVLEKLVFEDGGSQDINGVFIANEGASTLDFARKLGVAIEDNAIVVDKCQSTNLPGLYAAGDCTGGFKQIATAVGEGALAGRMIIEYVRKINKL